MIAAVLLTVYLKVAQGQIADEHMTSKKLTLSSCLLNKKGILTFKKMCPCKTDIGIKEVQVPINNKIRYLQTHLSTFYHIVLSRCDQKELCKSENIL